MSEAEKAPEVKAAEPKAEKAAKKKELTPAQKRAACAPHGFVYAKKAKAK